MEIEKFLKAKELYQEASDLSDLLTQNSNYIIKYHLKDSKEYTLKVKASSAVAIAINQRRKEILDEIESL